MSVARRVFHLHPADLHAWRHTVLLAFLLVVMIVPKNGGSAASYPAHRAFSVGGRDNLKHTVSIV